jgi:hypothetical protein
MASVACDSIVYGMMDSVAVHRIYAHVDSSIGHFAGYFFKDHLFVNSRRISPPSTPPSNVHEYARILWWTRRELILLTLSRVYVTVQFAADVREANILQRTTTCTTLETVAVKCFADRLAENAAEKNIYLNSFIVFFSYL